MATTKAEKTIDGPNGPDGHQNGSLSAEKYQVAQGTDLDASEELDYVVKKSSIATVIVSGVALFSDGYTAQIGS